MVHLHSPLRHVSHAAQATTGLRRRTATYPSTGTGQAGSASSTGSGSTAASSSAAGSTGTGTSANTGAADFRALFGGNSGAASATSSTPGSAATPAAPAAASTTAPTVAPTGAPNSAPTAQSVFGDNPWITNPGGVAPNGVTYNYNPIYFATPATAATVAQMLGGTVVQTNAITPFGPFQQNQPNQMVQLPNGKLLNAGLIADYYNHGWSQQTINTMIASDINT